MKKLLSKLPRLSRPARIVRNLVCAALLLVLIWAFLGKPVGERMRLRILEREDMVGPSEILANCAMPEGWAYTHMLVGETEYGICLLPKGERGKVSSLSTLHYAEKTGEVTLICAPVSGADNPEVKQPYTIVWILFSELEGVQAEVDLTLTYYERGGSTEDRFERTYPLEGKAGEGGVILLTQKISSVENMAEWNALYRVAMQGSWEVGDCYPDEGPIYADVRLYGADDTLLREQRLWLVEPVE